MLFLGERLNRGRIVALVFGFTGILVILRPGLPSSNSVRFAVLGAAIGFAITLTLTKFLTRTDSPLTILLYMSVIQLPFGIVLGRRSNGPPPICCNSSGCCSSVRSACRPIICTAKALSLADQTIVVPMDFMRLPLIVMVGWALYSESTELLVLAGAGLIFFGNYYSIFRENRRKSVDNPS